MLDLLNEQIEKFNEKLKSDDELQKILNGVERVVQIDIVDGLMYYTRVKNNHADRLQRGMVVNPDIAIQTDRRTLYGLINKKIDPIDAYLISKKIRIEASLEDKLMIRKFFY